MSPTRLLLEGPDLHTLLEQIRTQYGAGAHILQAERVRRGGIAGFFARERFNIQVEVSDQQAAAQPTPAQPRQSTRPVRSVMDLVDRLNQKEKALHADLVDTPPATGSSPGPMTPTWSAAHDVSVNPQQATTIGSTTTASHPVSTQSASFADVLSRLEHSIDFPALPAPGSEGSERAASPSASSASAPSLPTPWLAAASAPSNPSSAAQSTPSAVAHPAPWPPAGSVPWVPLVSSSESAPFHSPFATGAQMAARATRLGVPAEVLAGVNDPADICRRLLVWVESRPTAPRIVANPGQVIVVVGEVEAAMGVAQSLARELGVDPSAIYVAVSASSTGSGVLVGRLLSDVSDIAMRRLRWQQSAVSTIVVVEASLPPASRPWLASVVSALAPTFTYAVAQATTKVDDIVSWAGMIGNIDALALVNVLTTADPVAALAGPLTVGLLDGQRATLNLWMAMLIEGESR